MMKRQFSVPIAFCVSVTLPPPNTLISSELREHPAFISSLMSFAMEKLINELMKAGCSRSSLEIKVFGGGNVTDTQNAIGTENCRFIMRYLESEGLRCSVQDLGGLLPRRIHYYPETGRVIRRLLGSGES